MQSDLGRKSTIYFAALILNALLGIVVYIMLVQSMDTVSFGTYSFVIAVFLFSGMFFDFGIAPAGMRLMALRSSADSTARLMGALFLISAGIGVVFSVVIAGASFAVDAIWQKNAGGILLAASPFALVYPLQEMVLSISQGGNRMKFMSAFLLLPRVLLIALLAAMILAGGIDARMAVIATLATLGVAIGMAAGYLRPAFTNLGAEFRLIRREVREFGRQVYLGRLVDGMTTGLDKILLGKFHGMAPVGFYAIAMTMSTPLSMFSKAVAQSAYKRFVSDQGIARRLLLLNLAWCTIGGLVLLAACQLFIPLFFTDRFTDSLVVLPWLMAGFALAGLNHPYHAFLAARRQGRAIRIMSIATSAVNIVLNLALIPTLAMTGAAIAFVATYALNIVMNLHFYRAFMRGLPASAGGDNPAAAESLRAEDGSVHG